MRAVTTFRQSHNDVIMTPMIDVVFLLIIFFLVSSHLAQQEVQLELDLPSAAAGQEQAETPLRRITVNVRANGQVLLAGGVVGAEEIARRFRFEASQAEGPMEVRVRADRQVPYRSVEPILSACARAGIWNVTFAVVARRGE